MQVLIHSLFMLGLLFDCFSLKEIYWKNILKIAREEEKALQLSMNYLLKCTMALADNLQQLSRCSKYSSQNETLDLTSL
jgi:hypothetical protein